MSDSQATAEREARAREATGLARADALTDLSRELRGREPRRALDLATEALDVARSAPEGEIDVGSVRIAKALIALSAASRQLSEFEASTEHAEEALALLGPDSDPEIRADALAHVGVARAARDDLDGAESVFREGLAVLKAHSIRRQVTVTLLNGLGGVHYRRGETAKSLRCLEEASTLLKDLGDRLREARTLNNMGNLQSQVGDYLGALDSYDRAAAIHRENEDLSSLAITLENIALIHGKMDDQAAKIEFAEQSLGMRRELGDREGEASILLVLGDAYIRIDEAARAVEPTERSLEISRQLGSRLGEAKALSSLGNAHLQMGQDEKALVFFNDSLAAVRETESPGIEVFALRGISDIHAKRGETRERIETLESALEIAETIGDKDQTSSIHESLCQAHEETGDAKRALEHLRIHHRTEWLLFHERSNARLEHLRVTHQLEQARHEAAEAEQRALRRNAALLNAIVENTPNVGIQGYDRDGTVRFWNSAAESIFGWSRKEMMGHAPADRICSPEGAERFRDELEEIDRTGRPAGPEEWECKTKSGSALTMLSTIFPIVVEAGEKLFVRMDVDLTDRRKAEVALREALAEVQRLKDRAEAENVYLREEIQSTFGFDEIVGESEAWRGILFKVEQVAATDLTVLVLGETGTGKELIAHAIHDRSPRKDRPFVKVNCAALPASLIESELFGHEKGAFTGAFATREGRFELADGGTIFLDEIGELPLDLQSKLLRVLQESEFQRLGATDTQQVDVRVIAATNRDLESSVESGEFRLDLYYRLKVFPIELPPLRDRLEDLTLLVWHFIRKNQASLGKSIKRVPEAVVKALSAYHWPGNVRELENVLQRAMLLSPGSTLALTEALGQDPFAQGEPPSDRLEEVEREHIRRVLEDCGWKVKGEGNAAERLGMNPSTLRLRMKKHGLQRPTES